MEPPPCIQNAMMTKDKKPFTYTPGGINLSEIRSPRMARRIERNAAYEGVGAPSQQTPRPQLPTGSLPPATVAAMQPQMHVQVFPSGPPPPPPQPRGAIPPPPPPPSNFNKATPPPPPPMQPLPTQKIRTGDQQFVERPDMTKIIPENPMALLKKTGGPKIKNTLLDEMYDRRNGPQVVNHTPTPPTSPMQSPANRLYQSPEAKQYEQRSPPIITRKETPSYPQNVQRTQEKPSNVGSIYIPPLNEQQPKNHPESPLSPKVQSPGTPTLKEAPKPWQQKQQNKQEEVPEWAKREPNVPYNQRHEQQAAQRSPLPQQQQPRWPQKESPSYPNVGISRQQSQQEQQRWPQKESTAQSNGDAARTQPKQTPSRGCYQPPPQDQRWNQENVPSHPNAVYVTQPIVLQHPGGNYGPRVVPPNQNAPLQGKNVTVIPISIEGASRNPGNKPADRMNNQSTQEQMRKMQLNNTDQELLNRFKQDVDSEQFLHGQAVDPRYKGAAIPSKAFRMLQNMTEDTPEYAQGYRVPANDARSRPQVRTIPIQIEGGGEPVQQHYVPPSQQTPAEEPKKYTGSSIPSRSFRMLQAMTAPEHCAKADEMNENEERYWPYPPAFPMYLPPPYWVPCYSPVIPTEPDANGPVRGHPFDWERGTPSPFSRCSSESELEDINGKKVPQLPWVYVMPQVPMAASPQAPYFPYYCGYCPYYHAVSPVVPSSDSEEFTEERRGTTPSIRIDSSKLDDADATSSDTDTEVNEDLPKRLSVPGGLQTIKSVRDVNEYDNATSEEEDDDSDESECSSVQDEEIVPHQLSVIFEMSERTDFSRNDREGSIVSDGTTKDIKSDDEELEESNSPRWISDSLAEIVSRIENQINTRIGLDDPKVFDDEKPTNHCQEEDQEQHCQEEDQEQHCQNEAFQESIPEVQSENSSDSEDWWGVLGRNEDEYLPVKKVINENVDMEEVKQIQKVEEEMEVLEKNGNEDLPPGEVADLNVDNPEELLYNSVSASEDGWEVLEETKNEYSPVAVISNLNVETEEEKTQTSVTPSEDEAETERNNEAASSHSRNSSVSERLSPVKSRHEDSENSSSDSEEDIEEPPIPSIKDRIKALQDCVNKASTSELRIDGFAKNTSKSFEDVSEGDSGVTDMTDNDEFPELRKMSKYQRAATHSRLFQLLQEECDDEDEQQPTPNERKEQLTLPLSNKLADELVQSMLRQKKGQIFRNMSMDKLHAAAKKILQEDNELNDNSETPSDTFSDFLTPPKDDTGNSTPQEFYAHYNEYYDSWARAAEKFDPAPPKTFKGFQFASSAKCPRVPPSDPLPETKS